MAHVAYKEAHIIGHIACITYKAYGAYRAYIAYFYENLVYYSCK